MVSKGLEDGERIETMQTTASAKVLSIESCIPEETYCHSNSSERPLADAGGKDSQEVKYKYE